jgi:serine/threonine protein kinase
MLVAGSGGTVELIDEVSDADELRPWKLGREIGRGASGVVYAATDVETGEKRAIKLILPAGRPANSEDAHVLREIDTCVTLRHPSVVRGYAGGRAGPGYFLVMELCDGGSLESAVARHGPLPAEAAAPILFDVLAGLEYAHSLRTRAMTAHGPLDVTGLVHRDLKPANIFLAEGPHAKVGDFGLAKAFEVAGLSGLTRTGFAAGTPAFMPRQQLLDYKYASPAVDVWAAAASLYFALSGCHPRDFPPGRDPWRVVWDTSPVPLAQRGVAVPDALARVLDDALADDKDDLPYTTVEEFRQAIAAVAP